MKAKMVALLLVACGVAQAEPTLALRAARMLDVRSGRMVRDATVVIDGERIVAAGAGVAVPRGARIVELGDATLLPGLIDCHTHLLARLSVDAHGYELGLLTKSSAYRALEGAANARVTLRAGFTTVRDVENEGSGYADVALRDAIAEGLVEGPRMLVATRAIAATGRYFPFGISPELSGFPTGAQMVTGADEARRAAREQLARGADLLKLYADWKTPTLTVEEMRAAVEEAHKMGRRVAAHADSVEGIRNALAAGVDSIEHGSLADRSSLLAIKQKGAVWVPTRIAVARGVAESTDAVRRARLQDSVARGQVSVGIARAEGVKIAAGSDAAATAHHGRNVEELFELARLGLTPLEAIRAATVTAAELIGWQDRVGALEPGKLGDVIAVAGDPLVDLHALDRVKLVVKGGVVFRSE